MSTAFCNGAKKSKKEESKASSGGFLLNMVPIELDGVQQNNANVSHSNPQNMASIRITTEIGTMKEFVLSNLDIVQFQAEQIRKLCIDLDKSKNQIELLKQRLARMERRLSLHITYNDKRQYTEGERGRKRSAQDGTSGGSSAKKSFIETKPRSQYMQAKIDGLKALNINKVDLSNKLTTDRLYYTTVGELKVKNPLFSRPKICLEVPKCRIKPISSSYTLEGTENVSDDVYDRRHYKLMVDEKKRKRWDVQRIREQRQMERHRSRQNPATNNDKKKTSSSLWPQADDRLNIAVTHILPVAVFGINLPAIKEFQDFTLPWKEGVIKSKRRSKR